MSHYRPAKFAWVALAILASAATAQAQEIRWRTDYNIAWREASESGRTLFVNVGSEDCIWCRKLEEYVFRNPDIIKLLNEQFIPVKMNGNHHPKFIAALGIRGYPAIVFGTADGRVLGCSEGFVDADEFRRKCATVLAIVPPPSPPATPVRKRTLENDVAAITAMWVKLGKQVNSQFIAKSLTPDVVAAVRTSWSKALETKVDTQTSVALPDN